MVLLNNFTSQVLKGQYYSKRQINRMNIENFNFKLSYETWDDVFTDGDVHNIFNSFLNIYLRVFNSSFPLRKTFHNYDNKAWLTAGIRISCQHKRNLHNVTCLERYLHGYNQYMEHSHSDNAITVGRCVGIAESTNTLPEIRQRFRSNGLLNTGDRTLMNSVSYPVRRTPT
jgi:hypothetical protein